MMSSAALWQVDILIYYRYIYIYRFAPARLFVCSWEWRCQGGVCYISQEREDHARQELQWQLQHHAPHPASATLWKSIPGSVDYVHQLQILSTEPKLEFLEQLHYLVLSPKQGCPQRQFSSECFEKLYLHDIPILIHIYISKQIHKNPYKSWMKGSLDKDVSGQIFYSIMACPTCHLQAAA